MDREEGASQRKDVHVSVDACGDDTWLSASGKGHCDMLCLHLREVLSKGRNFVTTFFSRSWRKCSHRAVAQTLGRKVERFLEETGRGGGSGEEGMKGDTYGFRAEAPHDGSGLVDDAVHDEGCGLDAVTPWRVLEGGEKGE